MECKHLIILLQDSVRRIYRKSFLKAVLGKTFPTSSYHLDSRKLQMTLNDIMLLSSLDVSLLVK